MNPICLMFFLLNANIGPDNLDQSLQQLLDMVSNSTEDVSGGSDYIVTQVTTEGPEDDPILVIREVHHAAGSKKTKMVETQKVRCSSIAQVRMHAEGGSGSRNRSVILTYRDGSANRDAYRFKSDNGGSFGRMKSLRLGLFTENRARRIVAAIEKIRAILGN